jgi:nucleoside-diphosphate-sugar epimerase
MTQEYLIPAIMKQMQTSNELLLGNLETKRDYVHISDVTKALALLINEPKAFEQAINIGFGKAYSGNELVEKFEKAFNKKVTVKFDPARMRKSDNPVICADIAKISSIIIWSPKISLEEGLTAVLKEENLLR